MGEDKMRKTAVVPLSHSLMAGAMAGTAVDTILFPLDTIKTRLQSAEGFMKAGGFSGIYSGLKSAVAGSAPSGAAFFLTYDFLKQKIQPHFHEEFLPFAHMIAASGGEVAACTIRVPTEVVKQRVQTGQYATTPLAIRTIWKTAGIAEFYSGFLSTIAREIPFTCLQFPLYEFLKKQFAIKRGREPEPWESALCGSFSGGVAAAFTTPLDVVKTRLMLKKSPNGIPYTGVINALTRIPKEEGLSKLFAGIQPRVMWISIGGAIFFGFYEETKKLLRG